MLDTSIPVEGMTYGGDSFEFAQSETEKFWVEFRDIDGTLIEQQWVEKNGQATIPSTTPNYDSTYLEFDEWTPDGDLTNVKHNILAIATYKSKVDSTGYRPTILKCTFDSSALSPSFAFNDYNTTNFINAYIDYGDGSTPEQITANAMPHTYATAGDYVVKIYGDKYLISNSVNNSIFTSSEYIYALRACYIGANTNALGYNGYYNSRRLEVVNIPINVTNANSNIAFDSCHALKVLCLPRTMNNMSNVGINGKSLKYIVFGNRAITTNGFGYITALQVEHLVMPYRYYSASAKYIYLNITDMPLLKDLVLPPATEVPYLTTLNFQNASVEELDISGYSVASYDALYALPNLKKLTLPSSSNKTINNNKALGSLPLLEELIMPEGINITSWAGGQYRRLKRIVLPSSITGTITLGEYRQNNCLTEVVLGTDWNASINMNYVTSPLAISSYIDIAQKLKDNTGVTAKTIKFYNDDTIKNILQKTYILNGEIVDSTTTGAVTIEALMTSKNWTVSYAS